MTLQSISNSITIDLNGKTLTGPSESNNDNGNGYVLGNSGAVNVEVKNGTINSYRGFYWSDGDLTLTDVALTTTERAIANYDASTVTVGAGSTVESTGGVAVVVWGDGTYNDSTCKTPRLNVYGTVKAGDYQAISTYGTDYSQPVINVYEGASITSEGATAMYIPNVGAVNISGGTITGALNVAP